MVEVASWKREPDVEDNMKKVFEITFFKGMFIDYQGNIIDLRPKEGRPTLKAFNDMDKVELQKLLMKAY